MGLISLAFLLFYFATFVVYWTVSSRYRCIWVLIQSLIFYGTFNPLMLPVLIMVILISYFDAQVILRFDGRKLSKAFLTLGIALLIGNIMFFRYCVGDRDSWTPMGLSFYTLAAIAYLVDVYKKNCETEKSIVRYASFLSFFPCVLSGPIERSDNLLKQLRIDQEFSFKKTRDSLFRVVYGLFLKIHIADRIAVVVNNAFDDYSNQSGSYMLIAVLLFGFQLYADFAAYSNIAIGTAGALGYSVLENFRQPYFSSNLREFWGRWHISLSGWLRDYVYIPLGGSRCSRFRQYVNLIITFIISGIWHGRGFHYIVWGGLHAAYQIVERSTAVHVNAVLRKLRVRTNCFSFRAFRCVIVFVLVDVAWIFFRAPSVTVAVRVLYKIITDFELADLLTNERYMMGLGYERFSILLIEMIVWFIVDFVHERDGSVSKWLDCQNKVFRWGAYVLAVVVLCVGAVYNYGQTPSAFFYTKF